MNILKLIELFHLLFSSLPISLLNCYNEYFELISLNIKCVLKVFRSNKEIKFFGEISGEIGVVKRMLTNGENSISTTLFNQSKSYMYNKTAVLNKNHFNFRIKSYLNLYLRNEL